MGRYLSTWSDLEAYLAETHGEFRSHPGDHCRIAFRHGEVAVPIGFYLLRAGTSEWISLNTKICPVESLRSRSALVANTELPFGGICIIPEFATLQQKLPLAGLSVANLEHALRALADMRARLQEVATMEDADIDTPYAYVFR